MKEIKLTQNKVALVDDEDFECVNRYKWSAGLSRNKIDFYAQKERKIEFKIYKKQSMQHFILGIKDSQIIDHKNKNTLDNRKENLRIATIAQNTQNQKTSSRNSSGFKGVSLDSVKRKFKACISVNGKDLYLGSFNTQEAAGRAYDKKSLELNGPKAKLNFPEK
mgnify:CR=1 FL=1